MVSCDADEVALLESQLVLGHFEEVAARSHSILTASVPSIEQANESLLARLLFVAMQSFFLSAREMELQQVLVQSLGTEHNVPCRAFLLWQLLLNDHGQGVEAKGHLEHRLRHLMEQTSSGAFEYSPHIEGPTELLNGKASGHVEHCEGLPGVSYPQPLQDNDTGVQEMIATCRCYVLDTLCDSLRDYDGAATWLRVQQGREHLPEGEVLWLIGQVQERSGKSAAGGSREPGPSASATVASSRTQEKAPAAAAATADPIAAVGSGFFTMMGDLSDDGKDWHQTSPQASISSASGSGAGRARAASGAETGRRLGQATVATARSAAVQQSVPRSCSSGSKWVRHVWTATVSRFRAWQLGAAARLARIGAADPAASWESWRHTLYILASCAVVFALVAESRTLGAAAKRWWRELRAALRAMMAEMLSMGFAVTPNPITNGYAARG